MIELKTVVLVGTFSVAVLVGCDPSGDDSASDTELGDSYVNFESEAVGDDYLVDNVECTSADCCQEIHVNSFESDTELENFFGEYLPNEPVPPVEFESRVALVSYSAACPNLWYRLAVDEIQLEGTQATFFQTLTIPLYGPTSLGRPYNVISVSQDDYDWETLEVELTAVEDTGGPYY